MSGDPAGAAAYSRQFAFCGSTGFDVMEPLTCRGRRGTGGPASTRLGYVDGTLAPRWDWEKYVYWYRVWGRLAYNPDTTPDVWRRAIGSAPATRALEASLAQASRILPIVTTTHLPSAACDAYWPEIYWNQPMAGVARPNPYGDTPAPRTFQHVSALDPQLFLSMSEAAAAALRGERSGRYSPVEVAQWLEDLASGSERDLARAGAPTSADGRRLAVDIAMQAGLGRFFAAKFRAGLLYATYEASTDRRALDAAITAYRRARGAWASIADRARGVYAPDLSASDKISERGQWIDRLAAIDEDIDRLTRELDTAAAGNDPRVAAIVRDALARPARGTAPCTHEPPRGFRPGSAVPLTLALTRETSAMTASLHYRHVNQSERYERVPMTRRGPRLDAAIPAAYTDSPYPLQYYFDIDDGAEHAWLCPGFAPDLMNQPYFVLQASRPS
jgi:hypothetical protein